MMCTVYAVMLNALLYTFILYHILFLIICNAFMCVHCIVFYSSATEALINNNNNNNNTLRLPRHSPMALVMHGAFNVLFNYCIHSRGEYNKGIGSLPLLLCGGRILRGGLSMTEVYTKCTVLFIVHHRTPALGANKHFVLGTVWM